MTPTFADACRGLLDAPGADHSLYTTLAPLYASTAAAPTARRRDERTVARVRERLPPGTGSVLVVGCGVGGVLARLADVYDEAVGIDPHTELLAFARPRTDARVVAAPLDRWAFDRRFDAVVAVGRVADRLVTAARVGAFLRAARSHLRPGGGLVVDAVADPDAVREDAVSVYTDVRYRLERAVDVAPARGHPGVDVRASYRVTDRETGETATAAERLPVRTYDAAGLARRLRDAGFDRVDVAPAPDAGGRLVAAAARPVETE